MFKTEVEQRGSFSISAEEFARLKDYGFVSGTSSHADRLATIRSVHQRFGVIVDTHTADGLKVARQHVQPGITMIVLETALPAKFAETIVEALGIQPPRPVAMQHIEDLPKRFTVMPISVADVKAYVTAHA